MRCRVRRWRWRCSGFARLLRGTVSAWARSPLYAVGATLAIYLHLTSVLAVAAFGAGRAGQRVGRRTRC